MSETLTLHNLHPSPNSLKVRIALGAKGLRYESVPVDPQDRTALVELSGQPLAPVLQHGSRVIFDSSAILRYLDANFRQAAPLFHAERAVMSEIEDWERWFRAEGTQPVRVVFGQFFSGQPDAAACTAASSLLNDLTLRVEQRLADRDWLCGGRLSAADIVGASSIALGMVDQQRVESVPRFTAIMQFFRERLELGPGRDRTRAWVERVLAFDR